MDPVGSSLVFCSTRHHPRVTPPLLAAFVARFPVSYLVAGMVIRYAMPMKMQLPLHSSCNVGRENKDVTLFFGLSGGTGDELAQF